MTLNIRSSEKLDLIICHREIIVSSALVCISFMTIQDSDKEL